MNEIVSEWVQKAQADLLTSRRELAVQDDPNYDAVCFHAQQCAEKYLKACLVLSPVISYVNGKIRRGGRGWRE